MSAETIDERNLAQEQMEEYDDAAPQERLQGVALTTDPVRDYLNQISRVPLLKAEEEVEVSKDIEAGLYAAQKLATEEISDPDYAAKLAQMVEVGTQAKQHMIEANLRLVVKAAKRYAGRGLKFLDLIQEGNLGLIHAVEMFDYAQGYKFSTYAMWWIHQGITRALADTGREVRIPVYRVGEINKILKFQGEMSDMLGRRPSISELATYAHMEPKKVETLLQESRWPVSLQATVREGEGELGDFIVDENAADPEEAAEQSELTRSIHSVFKALPPLEVHILTRRFGLKTGDPETLEAIGESLGLTRERIRQIEDEAMAKLRATRLREQLADWAMYTVAKPEQIAPEAPCSAGANKLIAKLIGADIRKLNLTQGQAETFIESFLVELEDIHPYRRRGLTDQVRQEIRLYIRSVKDRDIGAQVGSRPTAIFQRRLELPNYVKKSEYWAGHVRVIFESVLTPEQVEWLQEKDADAQEREPEEEHAS